MDTLTLTAPEPVKTVEISKAAGLVPIDTTKKNELAVRVDSYVAELVGMQSGSPDFLAKMDQLSSFGQKEIQQATSQSNKFLDKPIRAMNGDEGVGKELIKLRSVVEDLDPGKKGNLLEPRKIFGFIPFGSKLKNYFDTYKSSQEHIAGILRGLANGKDELLQDNIAIDSERRRMWDAMEKLEQMIHMASVLDERLESKAADLDSSDPAKAKSLRENALFQVRQRHQDLLTQMAVTVQGYLALDLVKKNNVELIKGVDRASTTTVAALRTAVTVAQALGNQRLVLEQITALNSTTAGIIDSTGQLLRDNTARIQEQAASSTIPVETLKRAFENIYATMDSIDTFKLKALESMKATVNSLDEEMNKAKGRMASMDNQGAPSVL